MVHIILLIAQILILSVCISLVLTECIFFNILGLNCPHLVTLSVMNCHGVTDRGVQSICSGQTRKLQNISLQDSGATEQSVIQLLRTLPELKEVEIDNNISGLVQVIEEDIVNGKMDSKYGIRKIHWDTSVPLSTHLSLIVDHCPFVTDVTCHGVISGDILKKLSCIKTMKKLNLASSLMVMDMLDIMIWGSLLNSCRK